MPISGTPSLFFKNIFKIVFKQAMFFDRGYVLFLPLAGEPGTMVYIHSCSKYLFPGLFMLEWGA